MLLLTNALCGKRVPRNGEKLLAETVPQADGGTDAHCHAAGASSGAVPACRTEVRRSADSAASPALQT